MKKAIYVFTIFLAIASTLHDEAISQQTAPTSTTMPQDILNPLLQDRLNTQPAKTKVPLEAVVGVQASLTIMPGQVKLKKFHGLKVRVTNNTDRPIVVDGDDATAIIGGANYKTASLIQLEQINRLPHTFEQKLSSDLKSTTTATLTVGAVQTAEGIKRQAGPILPRYEGDEKRREVEDTRFGKRVVYPGEDSEGIIYFLTGDNLQGATIQLPTSSLYDNNDKASLSKRVE